VAISSSIARVLDEATVRELVAGASEGDARAWEQLVDGFAGLVWSVVRGHGIYGAEAADICQTVWLRLVEHLGRLREPERAGAWLATTARHECLRVLRRSGRSIVMADPPESTESRSGSDPVAAFIAAEDHAAFVAALALVPAGCQTLLRLLTSDPPLSYDDISALLEMPKGSIGPTRMRCLDKLRAVMAAAAPGASTTPPPGGPPDPNARRRISGPGARSGKAKEAAP
jgi:RNA polymerase sigma factor (sigma-70 family)